MSKRLGCVAAFTAVLVVAVSWPAAAGPFNNQLACAAVGNVSVGTPDPAVDDTVPWSLSGNGLCVGDKLGPHVLSMTGSGVSTNLGLCDGLVVTDLRLSVSLQLVSVTTGGVTNIVQTWRAPVTTFPVATPFVVNDVAGKLVGGGTLLTRIAGQCPPKGTSSATFQWGFVRL